MPKMKSKRSASKRVHRTKSGKLKMKKANSRHILTTKSPKRKRQYRKEAYISSSDKGKVLRTLPYIQ